MARMMDNNNNTFDKNKTLKIPYGVTKIQAAAYQDDNWFTCVDMRQSSELVCIEERAFHRCQELLQVFLPPNLQMVGRQAFKKCEKLETVVWEEEIIPNGMEDAVEGSADLVHTQHMPLVIGEGAFSHCVQLVEVRLPWNLKMIADCAFFHCPKLRTVNLESTMVSRIGESALEGCTRLSQIGLPSCLEEIADHAFLNCTSLERLDNITFCTQLKTIGQGALEGCKSFSGTLDLTGTIVEEIQADAFKDCTRLQIVLLNQALTDIESNAFAGATVLQQVIFHPFGNLTSIGPRAFCKCTSLVALEFPASLESIDYEAFYWCLDLVSVQFHHHGSLSCIAEDAFGCCRLRNVTIPSSVDYLMQDAFSADCLERIDVDGDRLELSIRLWRMYPNAYVGMPVEKWCYLYCHADQQQLLTLLGPADMEKLDIVKGYVADKLYKLVLWSVSVGSIGT